MSNDNLFRKSSLENLSSPEQLNDYIKVSNPSVWLVLAGLFILLAAVFVWGFTGSLPTTVSAKGLVSKGEILCFISVEDAEKIAVGQKVSITENDRSDLRGQVFDVGQIPVSITEISAELQSDYLVQELVKSEFAVKITITPDQSDLVDGTLLDVRVVTDSVKPINFLLE